MPSVPRHSPAPLLPLPCFACHGQEEEEAWAASKSSLLHRSSLAAPTGDTSSHSKPSCQEVSGINPPKNEANYLGKYPAEGCCPRRSSPRICPSAGTCWSSGEETPIPHRGLRLEPVKPQNIYSREQTHQNCRGVNSTHRGKNTLFQPLTH